MTKPSSTRPWAPGDPHAEYEALLNAQAKQEGLSVAESTARARKRYGDLYSAAHSRAKRLGVTIPDLYDRDRELIVNSHYPSEACILPFEVEAYLAAKLAPERCEHVQACSACSALVVGAVPSATRKAEWKIAVRDDMASVPWLSAVFATSLPIGGLAALFGGWRRASRSATCAALTASVFVLLLLTGIRHWDRTDTARELKALATSVATTAVSIHRSTGAYPRRNQALPFTVSTYYLRGDAIRYEVAAPGDDDSQRFVANLRGDAGTLYRNEINPDMIEAKIITGDITKMSLDSITIRDLQGNMHSLLAAVEAPERNIARDDQVIAVTNAEMTRWISVVMLPTAGGAEVLTTAAH